MFSTNRRVKYFAENLATKQKATQSSVNNGGGAEKAVDGHLSTCTDTQADNDTWWRIHIPDKYKIHTVSLHTGVPFTCKI